jgi:hypothetical protein
MNLYLQFLTQNQEAATLRILRAATALFSGELKVQARVFTQAATSRLSMATIAGLMDKMSGKRFNSLELLPETRRLQFGPGNVRIQSLRCVLSPSPTCALWLPTSEWKIEANKASRQRYMTAKNSETVLKYHGIKRQPSELSLHCSIATKDTESDILDACAERLLNAYTADLEDLEIFGYADVVKPIFVPALKKSLLMPEIYRITMNVQPQAYPELGKRFDVPHRLMFGSKKVCEGIAAALGKDAKLIIGDRGKDFGVVRLATPEKMQQWKIAAKKWLLAPNRLAGSDR